MRVTGLRLRFGGGYVRRDNRKQIRPPAGTGIPNEGLTAQEAETFPMADPQSNAPSRADAGAPTSGVIHVRTRLTADFTVLSNALAQRRGSAVTVGVAAYISSLPTGAPVTIAALCAHFTEGEILISRALRDLESAGYLERRRERVPTGHIRTRTYFHTLPVTSPRPGPETPPDPQPPDPDGPPRPPRPRRSPRAEAAAAVGPTEMTTAPEAPKAAVPNVPPQALRQKQSPPPPSLSAADPEAVAVLASLCRVDPRLVLSERDAVRLAPGVTEWLAAGVGPDRITALLTAGLPGVPLTHPAGILAYRLRQTPLPAPPPLPEAPPRPVIHAFVNCDRCEKAFRAPEPGLCRHCAASPTPPASPSAPPPPRATRPPWRTLVQRAVGQGA